MTPDSTDSKQLEEELIENEKVWQLSQDRLNSILSSLKDVVWSFDPRISKLLYLNSATEKVYGRNIGEFFQNLNLWQEVVYPEDRPIVERANVALWETGSKDVDYRIVRPDGEIRWIRERSHLIYDTNGTPIRIDSIATDISERQGAEEALRLSEKRFRLAVEHLPDVFVIYDAQRRYQFVNTQGIQRSGKSLEAHLGRTDEQVWPKEITDAYLPILKRVVETRSLQSAECTITVPPNDSFTMVVKYVPLLDERGEIYQILGLTHDITERKRTEEALRHSQERLNSILSSLEDVVWSLSPTTFEVLYLNPATERVYGRPLGEFFDNANLWLEVIHPEDRERFEHSIPILLERGSLEIEYRIMRPDGDIRWLSNRSYLVYDVKGTLTRIDGLAIDITERKQAEEIKAVLLKEIHHRVKNNMQVIVSLLDLQAECLQDSQSLNALRDSQSRIHAMALIHEQLYGSDNLQQIDFQDYINSLVRYLVESYAVEHNCVEFRLDIERIFLDMDTAIPCGLIINELISNALKYGFPQGNSGEITIKFHQGGTHRFELMVYDTGLGFPENFELENVTSLGLRLVHSLATMQLEGTIEVDSTCGAMFRINF
ncbi:MULTISPECIES: PAS domain-containing protein [unclassified Coleofasciculus]|uniref:PAS domain-containing protein n=1 Tax=unclassified Coleofasciculus TaxID=2692782 RepID=UPI00188259DD|nr:MULTISPECIES: PAS domain-containing protein [unclassified Coleofasciculus]MBE9127447.1 PAS domain-containing protein [Coleofasciculus sp. LEGE 07081]MBE9150719.1 PAS domain-containing protein [Coleofasciculus sp. LEGE 07092]